MKFQKFLYWFHTQEHHNLFTHEHMERESWRDAYMVFFPPSVVSTLILIFCLEGWIVSKIAGTDFGFLCTGTLSAYYLLYEFVHFASHSSKNAFFYKIPVLRFLTRHHRIHHDPRIMSRYNFDIAFPMSDWIFGTLKKTAPDEST